MLLLRACSRIPARIMANNIRGVWSISKADGQEPPHVPHWMHISAWATPAVAELTSSRNLKFGFVGSKNLEVGLIVCVAVVKGHLLSVLYGVHNLTGHEIANDQYFIYNIGY